MDLVRRWPLLRNLDAENGVRWASRGLSKTVRVLQMQMLRDAGREGEEKPVRWVALDPVRFDGTILRSVG